MIDDQSALRQYIHDGSEAAFGLLVRRHVDWVYSAALRQLRDPAAADDATQAAFILLARKAASLTRETNLSSWLFKVVRYEAMFLERSRRRRLAHERAAATVRSESETLSTQWNEIAPLLDEAVAKLSEADRKSILLRFYQRMSFAGVSIAMNTSEEAARKRVDRAIMKLRRWMAAKGVEVPSDGLTAMMFGGSMVHSAPPAVTAGAIAIANHAANSAALNLAAHAQHWMAFARLKVAAWLMGIAGVIAVAAAAHSAAVGYLARHSNRSPNQRCVCLRFGRLYAIRCGRLICLDRDAKGPVRPHVAMGSGCRKGRWLRLVQRTVGRAAPDRY